MRKLFLMMAMFGGFACSAPISSAASADPIYTAWRDNDAIAGFDAVSFFSGKPLKGDGRYQADHLGATWTFSSQANLDLFKTNPDAFAPQYGGYCA